MITNCIVCQVNNPITHVEPLQMSEFAEAPWHDLSADFYRPLPSGEYLLVVIDDYTHYPVVKILHTTSTAAVIPVLDDVFSMFRIPSALKTDNGPPFNSSMFTQFADYLGFRHRKIIPFWPKANATASIPCTTNADDDIHAKDKRAKDKMKVLSDTRRHATHINIKPGDSVLCRQQKRNKLTPYNAKPLTVTKVKGTVITAEGHGHSITRNCSFFKSLKQETPDLSFELEN
ncbi:hypothetical protein QQF64_004517 [Cirrhinus molitorella]|uniref:Integrase catalytic domain-containing protein n=1 Tax=Cirrhinus molitorella TaxID=172907 RepID=A0ABR3MJP6_9TELE